MPQQDLLISDEADFQMQVLDCVETINEIIPSLVMKYDQGRALEDKTAYLVVLAALATHVSGCIRVFTRDGICRPDQGRDIVRHIERTAFALNPVEVH